MIGLGILALVYGDFALVWQPVAPWVPGRTALAYGSGVLMLLCGAGLLFRATMAWSVRILFPYLIAWALLKVPALVVAPQMEAVWLGIGELCVLLAGGWVLFAKVGVLLSIFPRVTATAEAAMISVFALLVWAPAIVAAPGARLPWTAFFITCAIAAAAWVMASIGGRKHSE